MIKNIDTSLFFEIYNLSGHSRLTDFLIVFFGEYFIYIACATALYFCYQKYGLQWKQYITVGISLISAITAFEIIKRWTARLRPFLEFNVQHILSDYSYAFPSGHTTIMFALATAVFFFNKKLAYFLYASGVIIGLARVAGGVHYPSDILGGAMLGVFTAVIVYKLWERYFPHNTRRL